jgi:hypothetical protein
MVTRREQREKNMDTEDGKDAEKPDAESKTPARAKRTKGANKQDQPVDKAPKRTRASKPNETEKDNVDKAPTRRRASKPKETEKDKEIEKKNSEPEALENKTSKTWAGRWIPTEANALAKFNAIRHVFDQCLSKKFRSPSSFQPPWFKQCSNAFKYKNLDKGSCKQEDLIAAAELEVEKFMSLDFVRI